MVKKLGTWNKPVRYEVNLVGGSQHIVILDRKNNCYMELSTEGKTVTEDNFPYVFNDIVALLKQTKTTSDDTICTFHPKGTIFVLGETLKEAEA